jgi:hypothetical protein
MLVAVLDEKLAPEFAPSGWKFTADAMPGRRMSGRRAKGAALA